jgi:hypothetical protein
MEEEIKKLEEVKGLAPEDKKTKINLLEILLESLKEREGNKRTKLVEAMA